MKRIKALYIFWFAVATLFCTLFAGENMMSEDKTDEQENSLVFFMSGEAETRITVEAGREFIIKIRANPSTGYGWSFQQPPDEALLKFKGLEPEEPDEEADDRQEPRLGAPEYEIWKFQSLQAGEAAVKLKYHRPWEKNEPPLKTHLIYITIR
jgi:inhibitor of cysteine peptidase